MELWQAFVDWTWPMNVHWFIVFILAGVIATIVAWVRTSNGSSVFEDGKYVSHPIRTFFRGVVSLLITVATLAVIVWCIYATNRPPEIQAEERLEIKPVVYPDGKTVQMFHSNGTNYNANAMFGCTAPDGSHVRRVVYKRVYVGVYYPDMHTATSSLRDSFILVNPDKTEKKADNVIPGQ